MADISLLSRLVNGVQRTVDLSQNALVVGSIKVGSASPTELTKGILDRLVQLQSGADVDATYHTHDGRYFTETELGSSSSSSGSDLIGDDATYTNFTPAAATVKGALAGIDSALGAISVTPDFSDSVFRIHDNGDATKKVAFEVSAIATATVRTISVPDQDVDLAHLYNLVSLSGVAAGQTNLGSFTGVTIPDNQTVKAALQSLETALEALPDPMEYKGNWAASTNTPTLADGVGNNGDVYYVTDDGTVDFGAGPIDFKQGDRVVYSGADGEWQKWDTTDQVSSVNGQTGAVTLTTANISESGNLYFTDARARTAVIAASIVDGDTTHAPSGEAVFEALALKQDADPALDEAVTFFENTDLTGAEAETLSAGGNADTLHSHAAVKESLVVGESMSAASLYAVRFAKAADAGFVAGRVYKATTDASSADNFFACGLLATVGALVAGNSATVVKSGVISAPSHGFTVGQPVYMAADGSLTQNPDGLASGHAVVRCGLVRDANLIDVQIQVMGIK